MPVLQSWLPSYQILQRVALVALLTGMCFGVYLFLGYSVQALQAQFEATFATATYTPVPTNTPSPTSTLTPTRDMFAFRLTKTPEPIITQTPEAYPTDVQVVLETQTPVINGTIASPFRLLIDPTYEAATLMDFPDGAEVEVLGITPQKDWLKAEAAGFEGWVNTGLVTLETPWTLDHLPEIEP